MTAILLYNVPKSFGRLRKGDFEIVANFETKNSISLLLEHIQKFIPDLVGVNSGEEDWPELLPDGPVLNYTYAFGTFLESVRPTLVLEARKKEYFGATPFGLYLSANKPHASDLMSSMGFLCPKQYTVPERLDPQDAEAVSRYFEGCELLVVKPAYEESSVGLQLVPNTPGEIRSVISRLHRKRPGAKVVQEYVEGLDVTVPVIGRTEPRCLPAVALFPDEPFDAPFVFDAHLKASKEGLEYRTVPNWPGEQRQVFYDMAVAAFRVTHQRDYARMDCRVSPDGRCWFLEMNANPQLGTGKGSFAVSGRSVGLEVGEIVKLVLDDEALSYGASPLAVGL